MVDFIDVLARRSARKKREKAEKEESERAKKKAEADTSEAPKRTAPMEGEGGYGAKGDAARKRRIEEMTGDVTPVSYRSGGNGSKAREKRLKGVAI